CGTPVVAVHFQQPGEQRARHSDGAGGEHSDRCLFLSPCDEPADRRRFHYGTWLAGRGQKDAAVRVLTTSTVGVACALLARLLKVDGDYGGAARAFGSIREKWVQLHPQIIVERDEVLRHFGPEALAERERWLSQVDALHDERVIERRVQWLDVAEPTGPEEQTLELE